MNIFISWSGLKSQKAAQSLGKWLPQISQTVRPWISSEDIEAGSRWNIELARILNNSQFGIVCLTKENLSSEWILFEAGALSKSLEISRIVPYLIDVKPSDLKGPLSQFQAVRANKEGTRKLLKAISDNNPHHHRLDSTLESAFEILWPQFESSLKDLIAPESTPTVSIPVTKTGLQLGDVGLSEEIQHEIESAESYEAMGDAWSASDRYANAAKKLEEEGKLEMAAEMRRRMRINISVAAAMMRGD